MVNENVTVCERKEENNSCGSCSNCKYIPFNGIRTYICKILECTVSPEDCCSRYVEKGKDNV